MAYFNFQMNFFNFIPTFEMVQKSWGIPMIGGDNIFTRIPSWDALSSNVSMPTNIFIKNISWDNIPVCTNIYQTMGCSFTQTVKTGPFGSYNSQKGKSLSSYIKSHATGFNGKCAKFVSDALEATRMSNGKRGDGYMMSGILRQNPNFKEVPVSSIKDIASIPEGAILVYDKGVCDYSKDFGHVEVAIGGGKAASDGIQKIKGMPSALFIPV